jgi:tRNA(Ile)-lysidine synthase
VNESMQKKLPRVVYRCLERTGRVLDEAGARGEHVLIAVSGGSDSMALLEILALVARERSLTLHVACIDHAMRAEAAAEQELVRQAALRCDASFDLEKIDPGRGDEDTMRRQRRQALGRLAEQRGCRLVFLGHNRDDQIETIVFRFLRGAGLGGLAGMKAVRLPFVRPLLGISRSELRELLAARDVEWAEDASNESLRYARGRLRCTVLPAIEASFGKGALDHLLDVAPLWRADEEFLEREAARLLAYASRRGEAGVELDLETMSGADQALVRRALRSWLKDRTGRATTSRHLLAIEKWLATGPAAGGLDLPLARLSCRAGRICADASRQPENVSRPADPEAVQPCEESSRRR